MQLELKEGFKGKQSHQNKAPLPRPLKNRLLKNPFACSTVGALLAQRLRCLFIEGDSYHPTRNIAKMRSGLPLTDEDRRPWLASLASIISNHIATSKRRPIVVSCSALKREYRRILVGQNPPGTVGFVLLEPRPEELKRRLVARQGAHFMPPHLLESQLQTLECSSEEELFLHFAPGDEETLTAEEMANAIFAKLS